jgi:hypothetical protein
MKVRLREIISRMYCANHWVTWFLFDEHSLTAVGMTVVGPYMITAVVISGAM